MDSPAECVYTTHFEATDENEIYVGRIRKDPTLENTFHVLCVGDNILKGAAQNTVQILKSLIDNK